jgi:proline dehydrogenase
MSRHAFVRRAVSRFMPGEDAETALAACEALRRHNISYLLTLLGENIVDRAEASGVVNHYTTLIHSIEQRGLDAQVSVKLTQLGLDLGQAIAQENLCSIAAVAAARGSVVWVDMEGSAYTRRTVDLVRRVCQVQRNIGLCLQAYLYRTADDLEALLPDAPMIRLVKGAYAEPATLAYRNKSDVDRNFLALAERMLRPEVIQTGTRVAIATHDRKLIREIQSLTVDRHIPPGAFEFQMLYGIQREAQTHLARSGYRVRILISYGSAWFPWYMRRLAERPANLWFVVRNLFTH